MQDILFSKTPHGNLLKSLTLICRCFCLHAQLFKTKQQQRNGVAKREEHLINPGRDVNIVLLRSKETQRTTDFPEADMGKYSTFSEKKMGQRSGLYSCYKFPAVIFDLYDLRSSCGTDQQAALFTATEKKGHLVCSPVLRTVTTEL